MSPAELVDELVRRGQVTHAVVADIATSAEHAGKSIERGLIDEGLLSETTVLAVMSELFGLARVELTPDRLDSALAGELPTRMLENFCVYPLLREPGSEVLPLATIDPFDVTAADTFHQITGRQVAFVLAEKAQIEQAIRGKLMGEEGLRLLADDLPEPAEWERLESMLTPDSNALSEDAVPIIRLVNSILREAIRQRASDIHIEPQEKTFRVRYRVDGLLRTVVELPKRAEKTCISRLKIMAGLDISSSRSVQDGRISLSWEAMKITLRVSTIASYHGETVVLRILTQNSAPSLTELGLSRSDLAILEEQFRSSYGMILITGPTGSGKTSTLYAALGMLSSPSVNIVTVEDPIEYQMEGMTQVQTNPKAGITFGSALHAFLRQDPDVILVGEIRDKETATTAVGAAQSGHLVLSTLHANDSPATLSRLVMMGVEPHLVSGSLLCVIAQRLVRRLCARCREAVPIGVEQSRLLALAVDGRQPRKLYRARGCPHCEGSGYRGRLGLFEILQVTAAIRQQIVEDPSEEALWKVAREEGIKTLLDDGLQKVERGLTSLEEVLRVVTVHRRSGSLSALVDPPEVSPGPRTVEQVMTRKVLCVRPEDALETVTETLRAHKISGAPVVDEQGRLLGVISYSDAAGYSSREEPLVARDAMTPQVVTVAPGDTLFQAAQRMWRHKVHRLIVMDDGELIGILTPLDLMIRTNAFCEAS